MVRSKPKFGLRPGVSSASRIIPDGGFFKEADFPVRCTGASKILESGNSVFNDFAERGHLSLSISGGTECIPELIRRKTG